MLGLLAVDGNNDKWWGR